jgi:hypothetical protein
MTLQETYSRRELHSPFFHKKADSLVEESLDELHLQALVQSGHAAVVVLIRVTQHVKQSLECRPGLNVLGIVAVLDGRLRACLG